MSGPCDHQFTDERVRASSSAFFPCFRQALAMLPFEDLKVEVA